MNYTEGATPDVLDEDITSEHTHLLENPLDHVGENPPTHDPFSDYPDGTDVSVEDESVATDAPAEEGL